MMYTYSISNIFSVHALAYDFPFFESALLHLM